MTLSYVNQSRKMALIESTQIPFRSSFNCRCMLARTIYIFSLSIHISTGNTTPWSLVIYISLSRVRTVLLIAHLLIYRQTVCKYQLTFCERSFFYFPIHGFIYSFLLLRLLLFPFYLNCIPFRSMNRASVGMS